MVGSVNRYRIAGHLIEVKDTPLTEIMDLLPSFSPFSIIQEKEGEIPLVTLSCTRGKITPEGSVLEEFSRNSCHYKIFSHNEAITCQIRRNQIIYHMKLVMGHSDVQCDLDTTQDSPTDITQKEKAPFLSNFLSIALALASVKHNTIKVHASAIEKEGKALLFLGKSGTGKSTHASLWLKHITGSTLINDDEPLVRLHEDGTVRVYGSPWSGKTPCYQNISAQVEAFVLLSQNKQNRLIKLSGVKAFGALFSSVAILRSKREHHDALFEQVATLSVMKPVYLLECRPDREAVLLSHSLLQP